MFDKKHIDAYSNIKAPDELYEKVANAKPEKSKVYLIPLISSLAACLVLIFGVAAFFPKEFSPEITFNGQSLSESVVFYDISPANLMDMRSSPVLSVPVEICIESDTKLTTSHGVMVFGNDERYESITLSEDASFMWEISRTGSFPDCTLTLEAENGTSVITLTQNEADGSFTAKIN